MNIISFSLFGDDRKYVEGALANLALASIHYPGWQVVMFTPARSNATTALRSAGATVIELNHCTEPVNPGYAKCWRLLAVDLPDVDAVIFRDTDSRLNVRERAAVDEWLESGAMAHVMADHPHHRGFPIFPGMFGLRATRWHAVAQHMGDLIHAYPHKSPISDILFTRDVLWPLVAADHFGHSAHPPKEWTNCRTFPPHEPWHGFVGQQCAADGTGVWP